MFARLVIVTTLLCTLPSIVLADNQSTASARRLAVVVERAISNYDVARPPTAAELARLDRQSRLLRRSISSTDIAASRKLDTADSLLAQLHDRVTHARPPIAQSSTSAHVETVTADHGGACANALGIDSTRAVRVTLPTSGDAWLRVLGASDLKVKTQSDGADPALEIYRGCGAAAQLISRNDDSGRLDAHVAVQNPARDDLFVRLTNSGDAAPITVSVVTDSLATVTGKVTDKKTGLPVANATVQLACSNFFADFCGAQATTDASGNYQVSDSAGSYFVRADASTYVSVLYPNAVCIGQGEPFATSGCNVGAAQYLSFDEGTTPDINFSLDAGHKISGQVRDATNQPLSDATVLFEDTSGDTIATAFTDSGGHYSQTTLPPTNYVVIAMDSGYASQMYQNHTCSGPSFNQCDISQATPVPLTSGDVSGVDFSLPHLASVTGTVLGDDNQPLTSFGVEVEAVDSAGYLAGSGGVDAEGNYELGPLPLGTYFLIASAQGYFSELYAGITCGANCLDSASSATTISVTTVGEVSTANFHLHALPPVLGQVTDAVTNSPVANVLIAASVMPPAQFSNVSSAYTDQSGNYTLANVPPGTYYVWAQSATHVDQVYPNLPCESDQYSFFGCNVSGAILLTIADGVTPPHFNFSLAPSGIIEGKVTVDAGPGSDLVASASINLYNAAGALVDVSFPDGTGHYVFNDRPPGTYFAQSTAISSYMAQTWQTIDCTEPCAATLGTPIVIGTGNTVSGIDFNLVQLDAFVGRVTDANGLPIGGAIVDIYDPSAGEWTGQGIADSQGYYAVTGSYAVSYELATEAGPGYVDQVYNGISCPLGSAYEGLCSLSGATPVQLVMYATQPHIVNFVLQSNDPIFANGFE